VAIASWAVIGVAGLLIEAIVRLAQIALPTLRAGLSAGEWVALAVLASVLAYFECWRGFIRSFNPRVVARAFALARAARPLYVVLAPLHAMSLFGDSRDRVRRAWFLVFFIAAMVVAARRLPPVWRAIVDVSVALSLTGGLVALCVMWLGALRRELAGDT
jgi:hypothetical protein